METIVEIKPLEDYYLWLRFEDSFSSIVNLELIIKSGVSLKLKDKEYFNNVKIDDIRGIAWENGFDFCPNFLREYINSYNKTQNL
jgi:hypothetical protein